MTRFRVNTDDGLLRFFDRAMPEAFRTISRLTGGDRALTYAGQRAPVVASATDVLLGWPTSTIAVASAASLAHYLPDDADLPTGVSGLPIRTVYDGSDGLVSSGYRQTWLGAPGFVLQIDTTIGPEYPNPPNPADIPVDIAPFDRAATQGESEGVLAA